MRPTRRRHAMAAVVTNRTKLALRAHSIRNLTAAELRGAHGGGGDTHSDGTRGGATGYTGGSRGLR